MAKIMGVDYEAIPAQASQMRTYGQELNREITEAYATIANMHNSWYGVRYNSLVTSFNGIVNAVNELLELVVTDIPFALETIANNYSEADRGVKVTNAVKAVPNKISELAISNDVGMKFLTDEVTVAKSNVSQNFKNAKDKMNVIESTYSKVQWESEASAAFASKFKKFKNDIIAAFDNLDSQFTSLMNQTLADIQSAENANTIQ